jgi:GH24 family phage-related lysozyme (muramidase)
MPIDYHERSEDEYRRRASLLIRNFESFRERAYDAGDRMATIGYGYTFNRNNNVALFDQAGVHLSPEERRLLAAVDAAPNNQKTALGLALPIRISREEARSLLENVSMDRYTGPADRMGLPNSDERAAVVSIAYNRGPERVNTHMRGFSEAIADGDRAEAWYQLRYNSVGTGAVGTDNELGVRARRNMEAQAFGLYDNPHNVTSEEARSVYRMFQLHRTHIQQTERGWGVDFDGTVAGRNAVAQANTNWPEVAREFGEAPTIAAALEPARDRLLEDLRRQHPDLADRLRNEDFPTTAIYLDPGRALPNQPNLRDDLRNNPIGDPDPDYNGTIDSRRRTAGENPVEIDSNDLLIGEGGNDTLRAHRGDDILIGGEGRDRMEGGVGRDIYVVGSGDTVMDNDGHGELRWNGRTLIGGMRTENDPANTWRSADGEHTYSLDGRTLTVANRQGETMQVENYVRGDLGLCFEDAPTRGAAEPARPDPGARDQPARDEAPRDQTPRDQTPRDQAPGDQGAAGIDRLGPQDRAVYDRMLTALDPYSGRYSQEQRENIAAAGLAEYKRREGLVQQPQEIGIYGDRLYAAYFPNGRDREPNFHANIRMDDVANTPARESLQQVDAVNRERALTPPTQQQVPRQEQEAPAIGGR